MCIILLLTFTLAVPSNATSINDAKGDKQELENKKKNADKKVNTLETEKKKVASAIEKLDVKLNKLGNKINDLNTQLDKTNKELTSTKAELKNAKKQEKLQYSTMKKRIKFMYENGETAYIDAIFAAKSFSDLLNRAEYIEKISEYDHNMLNRLEDTRENIAKAEKKLEKDVAKVESLTAKVEKEQDGVESLVAQKNKEIKKYESTIGKTKELIDEYEAGIDEQEAIIAKLIAEEEARIKREQEKAAAAAKAKAAAEAAAAAAAKANQNNSNNSNNNNNNSGTGGGSTSVPTPPTENKYTGGTFQWPVPSSSTITSSYGYRIHPITGNRKLHDGIDISAPTGASVVAAADGTVITATYSSSAGNYILISHGGGVYTIYMHNSSLAVSTGQSVTKGQHIASVGSTGMSTGPHCHFGVRVGSSYVNPMTYLQ